MNNSYFLWSILFGFMIAGYLSSLVIKSNSILFAIFLLIGVFIVFFLLEKIKEIKKNKEWTPPLLASENNLINFFVDRIGREWYADLFPEENPSDWKSNSGGFPFLGSVQNSYAGDKLYHLNLNFQRICSYFATNSKDKHHLLLKAELLNRLGEPNLAKQELEKFKEMQRKRK